MRTNILLLTVLHLLAPFASAQTPTPTPSPTPTLPYRVTDLGEYVQPAGLNDHGQVVFTDSTYGINLHYRGSATPVTLLGGYAAGINNAGQVIGADHSSWILWTPDSPNETSGEPVSLSIEPAAINSRGEIAGAEYGMTALARWRARNGDLATLGTFGGDAGPLAMNNKGLIAGVSYYSGEPADWHAASWNVSASPTPAPVDLDTVSGSLSQAWGINDLGDIVGYVHETSESNRQAFLYPAGGPMAGLGTLAGDDESEARDINSRKETVGYSRSYIEGQRAVLRNATGGWINLNDRIGTGTGWLLESAVAINECGQIVGMGVYEFAPHGYLLTPPNTGMVFDPDPVTTSGDAELADGSNANSVVLTAQRRCVALQGLYASGQLDGEYASTFPTATRVIEFDGNFDYRRSQTGFEEVMAYHHTDATKRYLNELGFSGVQNRQVRLEVDAASMHPDILGEYSPLFKDIKFRGGTSGVDGAEDAAVIWHENFHAILDDIQPSFGFSSLPSSREARAFNEGAADYWAASRFAGAGRPGHEHDWDAYVGKWGGEDTDPGYPTTPRFAGRVDSENVYPCNFLDADDKEGHNGQIWSSALWSIQQLTGFDRTRTDKLLIRALQLLPSTSARFRDAAKAFLLANDNLYSGADAAAIKTVLTNKGVYFEIASLSLDPTTVVGGNSVSGAVILTGPAPVGGAVVTLSETHAAASVPATVTVLKNQTSATFSISTSAVGTLTSGDITATYDGKDVDANLDVTP